MQNLLGPVFFLKAIGSDLKLAKSKVVRKNANRCRSEAKGYVFSSEVSVELANINKSANLRSEKETMLRTIKCFYNILKGRT